MNQKEISAFLRELADLFDQDKVRVAFESHESPIDPRRTVKLMIYNPREGKDKDGKDIAINLCMKCSGRGCSACGEFGWIVLNKIDENTVDYTPLLYNW
jgi:hypothetical protein